MTKRWQICWPPVTDPKEIQLTVWLGCFAAFFYAGNWGLIMLFGAANSIIATNTEALRATIEALIQFTIAGAIGWGIYKKSRTATVAGLILAVEGFISYSIIKGIINKNSVIMFVNVWAFCQSTRGIFAYHKIRTNTEEKV